MLTPVEAAEALEDAALDIDRAIVCKSVDADIVNMALEAISTAVSCNVPWACRGLEQVQKASVEAGLEVSDGSSAVLPEELASLLEDFGRLVKAGKEITAGNLSDDQIRAKVRDILEGVLGFDQNVARVLNIPLT